MKAMVFAAGVGSRLGELTATTPKCLMKVGDQAMLELVVSRLKSAGVSAIAINVHHLADLVIDFVRSKNNFGIEVVFSNEATLLDTGGGLKKLRSFFEQEEAFIIHNSDIFSLCDLSALIQIHRARNAVGTLAVMERASSRGLYFDRNNVLVGWTQESQGAPQDGQALGFSGISVASGELFSYMGEADTFSLIRPYLEASRATGRVWGVAIPAEDWVDMGTPEQLALLRSKLAKKSE
jgi:NDP-sugar pyrophosphorylase family protein